MESVQLSPSRRVLLGAYPGVVLSGAEISRVALPEPGSPRPRRLGGGVSPPGTACPLRGTEGAFVGTLPAEAPLGPFRPCGGPWGSQGGPCRRAWRSYSVLGPGRATLEYCGVSFINGVSCDLLLSLRSFPSLVPPSSSVFLGRLQRRHAPLHVADRSDFLSDPPRLPGSRCGVWENGTPKCAFGRSPGWRSGGRRFCVFWGGLDPPAPLQTPEYQWWGRVANK